MHLEKPVQQTTPRHSLYDQSFFPRPRMHTTDPDRRFPHSTLHINTRNDRPKRDIPQPHTRLVHRIELDKRPNGAQYKPLTVSITQILHAVKDPKILATLHPMSAILLITKTSDT